MIFNDTFVMGEMDEIAPYAAGSAPYDTGGNPTAILASKQHIVGVRATDEDLMRLGDIEQRSPAEVDYANSTGILPQQSASDLKLTGSLSMESVNEIGDEVYHMTGVRPPTSVQVSGSVDRMADMVTKLGSFGSGGGGGDLEEEDVDDSYSDDDDFEGEDDNNNNNDDSSSRTPNPTDALSTASAPQGRGGLLPPIRMRPYRSVQDGAFGVPSSSSLRGRGLSMSDLARPSPTPPPSSRKGRPDGWWRNDNNTEKEEEEENSDDQYSFGRKQGERRGRPGRGKNDKYNNL
jgi:hypothetical protein